MSQFARHYKRFHSKPIQLESNSESKLNSSPIFEDNRKQINHPIESTSAQNDGVAQTKTKETELPADLKAGVENLSGQSMNGVQVHRNSSAPAQLQAHAFAQGSEIHLGPGQEKHLPHEAWHIAQQRQGRVEPTLKMNGAAINHDPALEQEADTMGGKAETAGKNGAHELPKTGKLVTASSKPVLQGGFFDSVKSFFGGKKKEEEPGTVTNPAAELAQVEEQQQPAAEMNETAEQQSTVEVDARPEQPAIDDRATSWKDVDGKSDKSRMDIAKKQFLEDKREKKKNNFLVKKDTGTFWDDDKYSKKGEDGKRVALTAEERLEKVQKEKQANITDAGKGRIYGEANNPVDNLKDKMTDIVKTVQADEATLLKRDVQITGDAAVNAYFGDERRLNEDPEGLASQAQTALMPKYQSIVMTSDKTRLKKNEIGMRKAESLENVRESRKSIQETANDRSIVQMYWNELEKKSAEYEKANTSTQKENLKKESEKIYSFAFDRQFWVKERKLDADFQKDELESEGRIADMLYALSSNAIGTAVFNAVVSKLTAGFLSVRGHKDKRGFGTDKDFDLNLETGEAEQKDLLSEDAKGSSLNEKMGGGREWVTPMNKLREAKAEFLAKTANRASTTLSYKFTYLGQMIEFAKKFLGIAKTIISGLALWFTGIAVGFPPFAVPATMMSGVSYYLTLVNTGLSTLKLLFDGLAQITNNNPALFTELSGETAQSGFNVTTESLAFAGTKIGLEAAKAATDDDASTGMDFRELYDQSDRFDAEGIMDAKNAAGQGDSPGMTDPAYWGDKGIDAGWVASNTVVGAGAGALNKVLSKEANAGSGANIRTYDMSLDKDRRIKPEEAKAVSGEPAKSSAPTSTEESGLILQAYETSLLKSKKESAKFAGWLGPVASAKPAAIPTTETLSEDEQASAQRSGGAISDAREGAAKIRKELQTIQEER